jgi:hypothetical protein
MQSPQGLVRYSPVRRDAHWGPVEPRRDWGNASEHQRTQGKPQQQRPASAGQAAPAPVAADPGHAAELQVAQHEAARSCADSEALRAEHDKLKRHCEVSPMPPSSLHVTPGAMLILLLLCPQLSARLGVPHAPSYQGTHHELKSRNFRGLAPPFRRGQSPQP